MASKNKNKQVKEVEEVIEEKEEEEVTPEEVIEEEPVDKLKLTKEILAAQREREAVKQKGIYSLMGTFEIVRG